MQLIKYEKALAVIKEFEGFSATSYTCPSGIPTIGWGRTVGSMRPTTKKAEELWLSGELIKINKDLNTYVKPAMGPGQMAALISFTYNVGINNFITSTLLKRLNANDPLAHEEFKRWNKGSDGKVLPGLVRRRLVEQKLFLGLL